MLTDEELTKKTPSNPEVKADYGNFSMTPCSKQGWESAFQGVQGRIHSSAERLTPTPPLHRLEQCTVYLRSYRL